jgi:hypothetical protein
MLKIGLMAAFLVCVGLSGFSFGQDAGPRASELAAALDRTKYKKKDKPNVSIEFYIEIRNEPALRASASEYAGIYESEGCRLNLQVGRGGSVIGEGHDSAWENSRGGNYTLKDARIDGAMLSGTKVYENGESKPFEAVFVNRTISNGKNEDQTDTRDTSFGIGFVDSYTRSSKDGMQSYTNRVFLERR